MQERQQRMTKRKRQSLKEDSDDHGDDDEAYNLVGGMGEERDTKGPKGRSKGNDSHLQQKSPAEFFADNKNIAGFDNVRLHMCMYVYTCVSVSVCV